VLIGGSVFPLLGGVHSWFPKMTGRMLGNGLGRVAFAFVFVGFQLTFFPMHQLGLQGMPRRVYTYAADSGFGTLNLLATIGAVTLAVGLLITLVNVLRSLRREAVAGDDPWAADTLEWSTSSPPPAYSFAYVPVVRSRIGLWDATARLLRVTGLRSDVRDMLVTRPMDAVPDHRIEAPGPTIYPAVTALALCGLFVGALFTPWAVVIGGAVTMIPLILWFWPRMPARWFWLRERSA
jgi:heme/copper-type cytochrome/quinol oxidase subunit 1